MPYPVHTPISVADGDQLAGLLMYFEGALSPQVRLVPLAVKRPGGVDARVIAILAHGGRAVLNPAECQMVAWLLINDSDYARAADQAQAFLDAGAQATRQRDSLFLGRPFEVFTGGSAA